MNTVPHPEQKFAPLPDAVKIKRKVDAELEAAWWADLNEKIRGNDVRNKLAAITEFAITLRNASRTGKVIGTGREKWNLADEVDHVAKCLATAADEIRRDAK